MARMSYTRPAATRGAAKKIIIDPAKLNLPGPQAGGFIPDVAFSQKQKDRLGKWLDTSQIEKLQGSLGLLKSIADERKEWPKLGDERRTLQALADLFSVAVEILENRSESIKAMLDGISLTFMDDICASRRIGDELRLLRDGIEHKLLELPNQDRHRVDLFLVDIVAAHAKDAGLDLGATGKGAPFPCIVDLVKAAIGEGKKNKLSTTNNQIDQYLESQNKNR